MIVTYSDELDKQSFSESVDTLRQCGIRVDGQGDDFVSLGVLDNPAVALDGKALARLPNGNLISGLFSHPQIPLVTSYDGFQNAWHHLPGTWPGTIDTLIHLRGQRDWKALQSVESVADVACGTGPAGLYAALKHPNIKQVRFSDIEPNAVRSALENSSLIGRKNFAGYTQADGLAASGKYDVIIASAIPATPVWPDLKRPINPLFEGDALLEIILRDAPERLNKGGKLLISHSSVGDNAFARFANQYGATSNTIYQRDAAFRTEFLGDDEWVEFLVQDGGMRKEDKQGFPYWHTVRVKEVSYE